MTLLFLFVVIAVIFLIMGNSGWHLNRNQHNKLPKGELKKVIEDKMYKDDNGLLWELQPAIKNKFHQPGGEVEKPENPYPKVDQELDFDPKNPNLKFLSKTKDGGSYEAIMQPKGEYLTKGKKQGTYNYGHPDGLWGSLKHTIFDVIPHFVNSNYKSYD